MGDRCDLTLTMRQSDLEAFRKFVPWGKSGGDWWYDREDDPDGSTTVTVEGANYAWCGELKDAAESPLVFYGHHGSGGDYGPGMFAAFGGKYFETECNQNGDPVVAYDASTGKADKWSLRNMREFMRARTAAVAHIHREETSDGKRD